jgi:hypothetical protein
MAKRKPKATEPERLITSDDLDMLARVVASYDKRMENLHWDIVEVLPHLPNEFEVDPLRNVRYLRRHAQHVLDIVRKAFTAQFPEEQAKVGYVLKKIEGK